MDEVAVIVPLFNGARWIDETIASVRAQTRPASEIVVVDDGSLDDGPLRVRRIDGVRLLRNPGKGTNAARNHGLRRTQAPLVAFLDHDDLWHPRHLQWAIGVFEAHPEAIAVSAECTCFDAFAAVRWPPLVTPEVRPMDPWTNFPFGTMRNPSVALFRRDALTSAGGWNELADGVGDVEMPLRLTSLLPVEQGRNTFLLSDAVTVGYRVHHDSVSGVARGRHLNRCLQKLGNFVEILAWDYAHRYPERRAWVMRRLAIMDQFRQIGWDFTAGRADGFVRSVGALGELLAQEPVAFRTAAFHTLIWLLCPSALPDRRRRLLLHLHDHWPASAPDARSILWDRIESWPLRFFVLHRLRQPWRADRRDLLHRIRTASRPPVDPAHLTGGIDSDGWARSDCGLQFSRRTDQQGLRLGIELPGWAGLETFPLTVTVGADSSLHAQLASGRYDIVIPWNHADEMRIDLRCERTFPIPHDDRKRSLRIAGIHYLDRVSASRPEIRRLEPAST